MSHQSSEGVNPNVDVGSEGTASTSGGGEIGFDDIEVADKPTPKKKEPAEKKPVESKVKDENKGAKKDAEDLDDDDEPGEKKPEKKPDAKAEKPEAKDGEKDEKQRAKTFKGKHGDAEVAVSSRTTFTIPGEGGKPEEVAFQDLVNEYNGKKYHERTAKRLEAEHRVRVKEHEELNGTVKKFMETAQQDPDSGWDFLAELSGAEPVKFKMELLRKQIAEILPLARMSEAELEAHLRGKEMEWKEKHLNRRAKTLDQGDESKKADAERAKMASDYGIDEESWNELHDKVAEHKKKKGDNSPVTSHDVAVASRLVLAHEVIDEVVPHLAQRKDFAIIYNEIVSDLLKHPGLSRKILAETLKETFGEQNDNRSREDLKATSEKMQRNSAASGTSSNQRPKPERNSHETFDDL